MAGNGTAEASERVALLGPSAPGTTVSKFQSVASWPASVLHTTWRVLASNYVNVLLVFVPLGILAGLLDWSAAAKFSLNFIAIIPLASLLAFATEELAVPLGQTLGGLLNATFGNAVELIVSIIALRDGQIRIVQSSMLGSILSNMLLVLGCCFFVGGLNRTDQEFNSTMASTMSSLMIVATASLIIPATLYSITAGDKDSQDNIMFLSRGTSIILLGIYVSYLIFQLKTHTELFEENREHPRGENPFGDPDPEAGPEEDEDRQDGGEPVLRVWGALAVLLIVTLLVSVCADYLVASIDDIVESSGISKTFIGLILIPIVGNAAEHVTAVIVAYKNKMDLAIGVAIGSSLQIAIFVTPFLVVLGWIMDRDMSLHFETFETVSFFLASLVVVLLIQDGKSNYLEGLLCLGMYLIIAIAFWVLPDDAGKEPSAPKLSFGGSG